MGTFGIMGANGKCWTGLREETTFWHLKQQKHKPKILENEQCCFCREEYVEGEDLGTLECGHDFSHNSHQKRWLTYKNLSHMQICCSSYMKGNLNSVLDLFLTISRRRLQNALKCTALVSWSLQ